MAFRASPHTTWTAILAGATIWAEALLAAAPALAAPAKPHGAAVYTVTIADMTFGATPAGLKVGDQIEWVNNDIFVHSVTARDNSFNLELKPKAHVRLNLNKPGAIAFYCLYHPGMTGTLVVGRSAR